MRENRSRAGHYVIFAPRGTEWFSERFQLTVKVASGHSPGLCRTLNDSGLFEMEYAQFEVRRCTRDGLVINHAVSAIHDPGIRVNLRNSSWEAIKGRNSD